MRSPALSDISDTENNDVLESVSDSDVEVISELKHVPSKNFLKKQKKAKKDILKSIEKCSKQSEISKELKTLYGKKAAAEIDGRTKFVLVGPPIQWKTFSKLELDKQIKQLIMPFLMCQVRSILMDKTMDDRLMFTLNYNKQNYSFCR